MKVLVVPEDQTLDQYIVKPIVEALFADLGRRVRVDVLPEPRLRGASEALDARLIGEIVADHPMHDLVLLLVDRDCDREGNVAKAAAREKEHERRLIACLAEQEIEVWLLALHRQHVPASFSTVRAHCDPKETYVEPLLAKLGRSGPGRGRKFAMRELAGSWRSLRGICPELATLQQRIDEWLSARPASPSTK